MVRLKRCMVRTLGILVCARGCSAAAFFPSTIGAARRVTERLAAGSRYAHSASARRGSAPVALLAVCDRRQRRCELHGASDGIPRPLGASRAAPPLLSARGGGRELTMRQAECPAPVDTSTEMAKQYSPAEVEEKLYEWWEQSGFFEPAGDETKQCFVIAMPPPNVTGRLHMGHAMFVALEDIMARFHRMRGHPTLWLPGTDHAGIATQMLVERALRAEGVERVDLGRERFLERVWDWKAEYGGAITSQIRRLGASCDWSREAFTLQPELCGAVNKAFVTLHERGLVYRGEYMVNWSPELGTAVSDLEVDYVEEEGKLYYFKYPLADEGDAKDGEDPFIPVATTRPETILGDQAVCVHPEDERYKHLIGKEVVVPMLGRRIPVIADTYVEMDFGTGALKITPAHDINDYEIGKRYKLPMQNIMNKDATLNGECGAYEGLDRYVARERLWSDMHAEGLTIKAEPHMQRVPRSERSGEVIEPLVSTQWFVKMDGMAEKGLNAVRSGETQILPNRFEKVYFNWLENIQDWCVSRQLWWGHRIPVWYAQGTDKFYVAENADEARKQAEAELGEGVVLKQDEDVLDTWFSSGLWPFATVGWPGDAGASSDFAKFYPTSVMETGYDILFFWVARMMMLGIELTERAPFHTIYLHGLVRDGQGQKMSKTKGNVVDPIETIKTMGTDALRLSLVTGVTPGQDVPLAMEKIQANRNFANKLWNTARFLDMGLRELPAEERQALAAVGPMSAAELEALPLPERWVISRCHQLVDKVTSQLLAYDFGPAGQSIYAFLWDEYADWYIEISKLRISSGDAAQAKQARRTLVYVLDSCLRLLHPFMPYITEELWQRLPHEGVSLMLAPWPQMEDVSLATDLAAEGEFASLQALVRSVRNARAEYKVEPGKKSGATVVATEAVVEILQQEAEAVASLARLEEGKFSIVALGSDAAAAAAAENAVRLVVEEQIEAFLPLAELLDADKERARLTKQQVGLQGDVDKLEQRLVSPGFVDKAPPELVTKAQEELRELQQQLETVQSSIAQLPPPSAEYLAAEAEREAAKRAKEEAKAAKAAKAAAKKAEADAAAAAAIAAMDPAELAAIVAKVEAAGEAVRSLKEAAAPKEEIDSAVAGLLEAKAALPEGHELLGKKKKAKAKSR